MNHSKSNLLFKTTLADFFLRYQVLLEWIYWPLVLSVNAILVSTSIPMEYARRGSAINIWEPLAWEFSSVLTTLIGVVLIIQFDRKFPLYTDKFLRHALAHLSFSIVFSVVHILGMVQLRHWAYAWMGSRYDFGDWSIEIIYEYRKDVLTYLSIVTTLYLYRFVASRLISEAQAISEGENPASPHPVERFLVKKIGKEFLLRSDQIEWVGAAGNYMNLHVAGRTYPIRETLSQLEQRLDADTFVRVHRSYIVNLDKIAAISPLDSGDATIEMSDGAIIKLSRRYRDNLYLALNTD